MFVPNRTRLLRDVCFFLIISQGGVDIAALAFGGARGGISRAAAGTHGAIAVFALFGLIGVLRLQLWALVLHCIVTVG
jgi:hypothetical protein